MFSTTCVYSSLRCCPSLLYQYASLTFIPYNLPLKSRYNCSGGHQSSVRFVPWQNAAAVSCRQKCIELHRPIRPQIVLRLHEFTARGGLDELDTHLGRLVLTTVQAMMGLNCLAKVVHLATLWTHVDLDLISRS